MISLIWLGKVFETILAVPSKVHTVLQKAQHAQHCVDGASHPMCCLLQLQNIWSRMSLSFLYVCMCVCIKAVVAGTYAEVAK